MNMVHPQKRGWMLVCCLFLTTCSVPRNAERFEKKEADGKVTTMYWSKKDSNPFAFKNVAFDMGKPRECGRWALSFEAKTRHLPSFWGSLGELGLPVTYDEKLLWVRVEGPFANRGMHAFDCGFYLPVEERGAGHKERYWDMGEWSFFCSPDQIWLGIFSDTSNRKGEKSLFSIPERFSRHFIKEVGVRTIKTNQFFSISISKHRKPLDAQWTRVPLTRGYTNPRHVEDDRNPTRVCFQLGMSEVPMTRP